MGKSTSLAVLALLGVANAVQVKFIDEPGLFGLAGHNYQTDSPSQDLAKIGISLNEKGKGTKKCQVGDWTTVHWRGTLTDGRVVTDSRSEPGGLPKTFALGNS